MEAVFGGFKIGGKEIIRRLIMATVFFIWIIARDETHKNILILILWGFLWGS